MININLLPEALRKKENRSPQFWAGVIVAGAIMGALVFMITKYQSDVLPRLRQQRDSLTATKRGLDVEVAQLRELQSEINRMSGYVDAVKGLYKQRVVWSKILADIKHILNSDSTMNSYNPEMRYMWLTNFTGNGKTISMRCFATASNQLTAMQMPEYLFKTILTYTPIDLPEKGEEARLIKELTRAIDDHEKERAEHPELPLQGPEEMNIRRRMEEIKTVQSGGLALQPLHKLLVPGSLLLTQASWTSAPQPARGVGAAQLEGFPERAWSFGVQMTLK